VKRDYRLTRSNDFQRVKQSGKPFAHSLIVMIKLPNPDGLLRIGVSAGKAVGNAVTRNRAKRRMRASLSELLKQIQPGWDLVFLARKPIKDADFNQIIAAEIQLLKRAGIFLVESASE
jgi:ribonuclease P protein component